MPSVHWTVVDNRQNRFVIGVARSEAILAQQEVMAENKSYLYHVREEEAPKLNEQITKV